ncbi:MAG: hypothetical protein HY930_05045 [Euryarchaeota archaeon]|nr:hypothetical protein [Euryarchaeota archaeon]
MVTMEISYKGLPLRLTKSAYYELKELGMDLYDVVEILEEGYKCSTCERKEGVIEKCLDIDNKTIKVVIAKSYEFWSEREVYAIIHVGKFKVKK